MGMMVYKGLESTGYRCLFECVKQEGIEPVLGLVQDIQDINKLSNLNILVQQTIMGEENDLVKMAKKNKDIIRYLENHKKEFTALSLANANVFHIIKSLSNNMTLLNRYLENAKKLEELKVAVVSLIDKFNNRGECGIYKDSDKRITNILKYYTDGNIIAGDEVIKDEMKGYSVIPFVFQNATFLLEVINKNSVLHRAISITSFDFDGSKLPSEEEIDSYRIPEQLIKRLK